MDATPPSPAGEGTAPDALGDAAQLPAHEVARDHPHKWSATRLPDSLAALDVPLDTVWAAVQLALSGAHQHTLASTLGLSEQTASQIVIATTEQLILSADPSSNSHNERTTADAEQANDPGE
ncbi:MAG TPA: hypothetical protein VF003_16050 [Pseudonocardiaceae bacterium]